MSAPAETVTDWTDQLLELDVGAVAHGGHCVARARGPGGLRAPRAARRAGAGGRHRGRRRLVLPRRRGRGARRLAATASSRPCPWAGPGGCGGCDWQHAEPALQRDLKAAVVAEQLSRLAGIEREVTVEELPGGPLGWRTRMRMAVTDDGRPGLRAHRSHEVLPVGDCPIAAPGALLPVLEREWTPTAEVEIVRDADGRGARRRAVRGRPAPGDGQRHRARAGRRPRVGPARRGVLAGPPARRRRGGRRGARGRRRRRPAGACAWDLYGGAGLIAAPLAERVGPDGRVVLVESDPAATAAAGQCLADLPRGAGGAGSGGEGAATGCPGRPR